MKEVFKIVGGNEYPIKVFLEKMGYQGGELVGTLVDLREVGELKIFAVRGCQRVDLSTKISNDGSYATIVIPRKRCMCFGRWGILLTGTLNGNRIVSAERHVFTLVRWNGQDYVPPTLVDGEGSHLYNLKFAPADSDVSPLGPVPGWVGFAEFEEGNVSEIDVNDLQQVPNLCVTHILNNTTYGARFVAVTDVDVNLSFTFAGVEANLSADEDNRGRRYYYTTTLITGEAEVGISIKNT